MKAGPASQLTVTPGAVVLLLLMGILWGLQFSMLKLATGRGLSETAILSIVMVLLSVVFTALLWFRGERFPSKPDHVAFLSITSILGYVFPILAALYAAPYLSAGILTLLATMAPVITILAAIAAGTEGVSRSRVAAIVLGGIATLMVLLPELQLPGWGHAYWMVLALVIPICAGVESVYIHARWPEGLSSLQVVTGETVYASFFVLFIYLVFDRTATVPEEFLIVSQAIMVFVLAGAFESLIFFQLIKKTGGVFVSFGTFVSLFAGIGWGILIFGESHSILVWGSVILVCLSLWLAIRGQAE